MSDLVKTLAAISADMRPRLLAKGLSNDAIETIVAGEMLTRTLSSLANLPLEGGSPPTPAPFTEIKAWVYDAGRYLR